MTMYYSGKAMMEDSDSFFILFLGLFYNEMDFFFLPSVDEGFPLGISFLGLLKQVPQTSGLTTETYCLTVLEVGHLRSRCHGVGSF